MKEVPHILTAVLAALLLALGGAADRAGTAPDLAAWTISQATGSYDTAQQRGHEVIHLMTPKRWEEAEMTEGAIIRQSDEVVYPSSGYRSELIEPIPLCRYERLAIRENELHALRADQASRSSSSPDETTS